MTIAKRLMLACAGVVVGGLGFFTPRADAGMMINLQLDPSPPVGDSTYSYIDPSTLTQVGANHYSLGSSAQGQYLLFDIVATVTSSNPNLTRLAPTRATSYYATDVSANRTPYNQVLAQGVISASGTVALSGYGGVLNGSGAKDPSGFYQAGLISGDAFGNTAINYTEQLGATSIANAYGNLGQGARPGNAHISNGVVRSIGPESGDATYTNADDYMYFATQNDPRFTYSNDGLQGVGLPLILGVTVQNSAYPNGSNIANNAKLSAPAASYDFILGQVSLYMGPDALGSGTMQVKWQSTPTSVNGKGNQWAEDYIQGLLLNGQSQLVQSTNGTGYYQTSTTFAEAMNAGFSIGDGVTLDVVVPEPATLGLFAVGALVCGLRRNRRK